MILKSILHDKLLLLDGDSHELLFSMITAICTNLYRYLLIHI